MSRSRYKHNLRINAADRLGMAKLFIAVQQLPVLGEPKIDLAKLRDAYQSIKWELKII